VFNSVRVFPFACATAVLLTLGSPWIMCQSAGTGAVAGAVTDPSKAAIRDVAATLTSTATGQQRSTVTGENGFFRFGMLPPGIYRLRFAAPDFRTAETGDFEVIVTETRVVNQQMELGVHTDQVLISTGSQTLQTLSATNGAIVGRRAVNELPLTNRNYTQIIGLSPGTSVGVFNASAFGRGSQDVSVNGAAPDQNNYQMDGVGVNNLASTGVAADFTIYTGIGIPNPDAIQEFKVQTSLYDASYGRNPGANVNVVTRAGTAVFHGSLFEFFRNTSLNANSFFHNRDGGRGRQTLDQHQFGGSFGGPLLRDRLFVFVSAQETRQRNGVAQQGFASAILPPIPAGDRSGLSAFRSALGASACPQNRPGDARYRTVFGGVQVACDGSNINPVSLKVLQVKLPNGAYLVPSTGSAGFQAVTFSIPASFTEHQIVANADLLVSPRHTIAARYFYSSDPSRIPFPTIQTNGLPGSDGTALYTNTAAVLRITSALNSRFLNEARVSFQRNLTTIDVRDPATNEELGINGIVPGFKGATHLIIPGLFSVFGPVSAPVYNPENQIQWADQIHWIKGRHAIRAGGEFERVQWNLVYGGLMRGNLFHLSYADFLLGLPGCRPEDTSCGPANPGATNGTPFSNIFQCLFCVRSSPAGIIHGYRLSNISSYVQDDIRVSERLSLNLGMRWEYFGTVSDKYGSLTNVWLSRLALVDVPPPAGTLAGYVVPNNFPEIPPEGVLKSHRDLPIRNGPPMNNFGPRFGFAWQPVQSGRLVIRGGVGLYYERVAGDKFVHSVEQGNPYAVTLDYAGAASYFASLQNPFPATPLSFVPRKANLATGATSNLNLPFLDEELHTPLSRQYHLTIQYKLMKGFVLDTGFVGSSGINQTNYNHNYNTARLAGPANPIRGITTNTLQNVFLRVPYLGFQPGGLQGTGFDAIYNYNSVQATLRRDFAKGLQLQAAYTYSKSLTNLTNSSSNSNDSLDLDQQYGPANFSRPQRFVLSYVWEIPFGGRSGPLRRLANGWSLSGVTVLQSGTPLTITDSRGGTIYGVSGSNALTSIGRAELCAGADHGSIATNGAVHARLGGASGGPGFWNRNAFCATPVIGNGTGYGNSGVGIVAGPGQFNWDISIAKAARIRDRWSVQFRAEFFNALNRAQFANPGTELTGVNFGQITSTSVNPRLIQLALKAGF
jgi:hypothetical protein